MRWLWNHGVVNIGRFHNLWRNLSYTPSEVADKRRLQHVGCGRLVQHPHLVERASPSKILSLPEISFHYSVMVIEGYNFGKVVT